MKPPSWPAADHLVEAAAIVEAVRRVHANPELSAEARSDLPAVLDRLHLTGTARGAVAAALAAGGALAGLGGGLAGVVFGLLLARLPER
jgi:hypothetical protein